MQDIKNRDFTSLISNKIHYTQRNKIASYFVSKKQNISLSFSEEELIIFYHLLRFGYFDKEIVGLSIHFRLIGLVCFWELSYLGFLRPFISYIKVWTMPTSLHRLKLFLGYLCYL